MQKRLGVAVSGEWCYVGYGIYVDRTVYRRAVQVGTKILMSKETTYIEGCGWLDYYDEVQTPNIGLIMYGFLPRERKVSRDGCVEAPSDIEEFKTELSKFLRKKVYVTDKRADNAVAVHVEGWLEHREIKRDVKKFLKNHETPFEEIMFFNEVGKLIK